MIRPRLTDVLNRRLTPARPRRHRRTGGTSSPLPTAAEQLEVRTLLSAVPVLVDDINPTGDSAPENSVDVNGTLFFVAYDDVHGRELWKSDGTSTELVMDIRDGSLSSDPYNLTNVNGTLFFTADDGVNGRELWKSDGTTAELVKDIREGGNSSTPQNLTEVDGILFFSAFDNDHGEELWKTDGTTTELVMDIRGGSSSSTPRHFVNMNGTLFFSAYVDADGEELWKTDGTTTEMVMDIESGPENSSPSHLTNVNGTLFFVAGDSDHGGELWKSDGDTAEMVKDIREGHLSSFPAELTAVNDTLFFVATDPVNGRELWKSDGTNTELVMNIAGGDVSSFPAYLTNVNGTLFFTADDRVHGRELWKTDGTTTEMVMDIIDGAPSSFPFPPQLTNVNGTLFFAAFDDTGTELWKSDGTTTEQVADVWHGHPGSFPGFLTNVNGTLFFSANHETFGRELWKLGTNEAPTAVTLESTTTTLPENTDTSAAIKVADIVVTDDGVGPNILTLSGADAASFEIIGNELFLKANTALDFETQSTWEVTVEVDGIVVGNTPDATADFTLTLTDVNEAPTAVTLENVVDTIEENTDTSAPIKVADILITDDAIGTNTLTLSGADAASFEIIGNELFLRAGVTLDFETQSSYDVTVEVTDTDLGSGPHATTDFTLNITDVDETPPLVRYVWTIFGWKVQTVRSYVPWLFRRW